ncbi:aspartate aminotransferase [Byssothecium circinans]|uniref:Aspartate aminotransferase n=1 Tax=Byssothecium circinans TaxID=147558 RepID=A0A6A5TFQ9_9PLEO|nr:aspartate aminotransferase [Byssothecium circinans]
MFRKIPEAPADPVFILKKRVDADTSAEKVDLGVGVYRNEQGRYNELDVVKAAKGILTSKDLGHDYELTTGNAAFVADAAKVLFGEGSRALGGNKVTSVQAISGTGALHLAALFLSRNPETKSKKIYIGTPAWGNYEPLFALAGFSLEKYNHYDAATGTVDFDSLIGAVNSAENGSIFVLQACCHNPSGADLTASQWEKLADTMAARKHLPLFDTAYQGLGGGLDEDAHGVRHFVEKGFELLAAQSFSKNFALYGERVGVLHVVSENEEVKGRVYEDLRCLVRWEWSSSPAYGARLVDIVLSDGELTKKWNAELSTMRSRLVDLRKALHAALEKRQTPGNWASILSSTGLFCFLPLNPQQCEELARKHHIYMLKSGRINVSGLNRGNVERVAVAIDEVVGASQ